jgi:hypothetical protein
MIQSGAPRWVTSLADLCLLLLGFFMLLYAGKSDMREVARSTRGAFGQKDGVEGSRDLVLLDAPAAGLFEPDEARLTEAARGRLFAIGVRAAAEGRRIEIESRGRAKHTPRFDAWELAAARAAATARAIEKGGVPGGRISIVMPPEGRATQPEQGLTITTR